jgi:SagB-type dehydrogenase family enzyme
MAGNNSTSEVLKMPDQVGETFQQKTKYTRDSLSNDSLDWSSQPAPYKKYRGSRSIELYHPDDICSIPLIDSLKRRKSVRTHTRRPISMEELSFLLWASDGLQGRDQYRTAPSAGGLYPIETYVVINRVNGIEQGVYHYNVRRHALEEIELGNFGRQTALAALDQRMCLEASFVVIWTAVFERSRWKYGQRGYRYMYLDAGHIGQNLALACTGVGLGSCQIGALYDEEVNAIIGVDGEEESVLYMSSVGPMHR